MRSQKELIHEFDWECLIILDACRYDFFERIHEQFLEGDLIRVESEGTYTGDWLKNTFDGEYSNIVYVSGNPWVNSSNIENRGYEPRENFPNIIDAWEGSQEDYWKILKPSIVGESARLVRAKHPRKRMIVHFMQPHTPYREETEDEMEKLSKLGVDDQPQGFNLKEKIFDIMVGIFGYPRIRKIRNLLWNRGFLTSQKGHIEEVAENHGDLELREFYADSLKWVLKEVEKTVERLPDEDIVVTSDHGEFLGEENDYGHNRYYRHPILTHVPWLEVIK